jgi:hypothetical protein
LVDLWKGKERRNVAVSPLVEKYLCGKDQRGVVVSPSAEEYFLMTLMESESPPLHLSWIDVVKGLVTSGALSAGLGSLASHLSLILPGHPAEAALAAAIIGYIIDLIHRFAGGTKPAIMRFAGGTQPRNVPESR